MRSFLRIILFFFLLFCFTSLFCRALPQWEMLDCGYPLGNSSRIPPRSLVYDNIRESVVTLIDGILWEWNGDRWIPIPSENELPVFITNNSRFVYDRQRNTYILWMDNLIYEWKDQLWKNVDSETSPPARVDPMFVYDPEKEVTHLFGGKFPQDNQYYSDHWTWNGVDWSYEETFTTSPLSLRSFRPNEYAFNEKRGVLVTGFISEQEVEPPLFEIWEWDGETWKSFILDISSFYPYIFHSYFDDYYNYILKPVYDYQEEIILFMPFGYSWDGENLAPSLPPNLPLINNYFLGDDFLSFEFDRNQDACVCLCWDYFNNTWEWDRKVWRLKAPVSTIISYNSVYSENSENMAMTFDKAHSEMLLLNLYGELYFLKDDNWEPHYCTNRPTVCDSPSLSFDEETSNVILLSYNNKIPEKWIWDGTNWSQDFSVVAPLSSHDETSEYDPVNQRLISISSYMYDGNIPGFDYLITFETTSDTTNLLSPDFKTLLAVGHGMFREPSGNAIILQGTKTYFGPIPGCMVDPPDTWKWEQGRWHWLWNVTQTGTSYSSLFCPAEKLQTAFSFGGDVCWDDLVAPYNYLFFWKNTGWEWIKTNPSPTQREDSGMAFDARNKNLVLFGGKVWEIQEWYPPFDVVIRNDTWIWDGNSWHEEHPISDPSSRWGHVMAYDETQAKVILYGGKKDKQGSPLYDTWIYDGKNWKQEFPEHPPDVIPAGMIYNPAHRRITLFACNSDQVFEWNGKDWSQLDVPDAPVFSMGSKFAYYREENAIMVYGVKGKPLYPSSWNSMWKLSFGLQGGMTLERLISHILGSAPFKESEIPDADLNQDGNVDSGDVIYLISNQD